MFIIRDENGMYWDGGMFRPASARARSFTTRAKAQHEVDNQPAFPGGTIPAATIKELK